MHQPVESKIGGGYTASWRQERKEGSGIIGKHPCPCQLATCAKAKCQGKATTYPMESGRDAAHDILSNIQQCI